MKHRYAAATLGLALGWLGCSATAASAASPTGYWLKEDGAAKLQIESCGGGSLCSHIVWLRNPNDSRGNPLHDARNENVALRSRPIIGLHIFDNLSPSGANEWKGQIYNPEDGGTYKATLTMVSSNQLVLKGCLAMFLCGQKTWTRTTFTPPAAPDAPKEIEVKHDSAPDHPTDQKQQVAESKPRAITASVAALPASFGSSSRSASTTDEDPNVLHPVLPPARKDATAGYGLVLTTASPDTPPQLIEGDPSNMYFVSPIEASDDTSPVADSSSGHSSAPASAPSRIADAPVTTQSIPVSDSAPAADGTTDTAADASVPLPEQRPPEIAEYAEAETLASQDHLSWRERRRLRKLQRELPWLQPQASATSTAPTATVQPGQ
jgi:uncharacterized protein (DUF2147 family)